MEYFVVTPLTMMLSRFLLRNGDLYTRVSVRSGAKPMTSLYISGGESVPDISIVEWLPFIVSPAYIDGSRHLWLSTNIFFPDSVLTFDITLEYPFASLPAHAAMKSE